MSEIAGERDFSHRESSPINAGPLIVALGLAGFIALLTCVVLSRAEAAD